MRGVVFGDLQIRDPTEVFHAFAVVLYIRRKLSFHGTAAFNMLRTPVEARLLADSGHLALAMPQRGTALDLRSK